jgi:hypothetical protein
MMAGFGFYPAASSSLPTLQYIVPYVLLRDFPKMELERACCKHRHFLERARSFKEMGSPGMTARRFLQCRAL